MNNIAVVYWSGTGNTQTMAEAVGEGAKSKGANVDILNVTDFNKDKLGNYDAIAFGCPAMGAEVLEESEFEPMFASLEDSLKGKIIALFGSYGWGDGQWLRDWEQRCINDGAIIATESVKANEAPSDDVLEKCKNLGASLC